MGIEELRTPANANQAMQVTDPNVAMSQARPVDIIDPNLAIARAKPVEISYPGANAATGVTLSDIAGKNIDRGRMQTALDGIDTTGARQVDGQTIIDPSMIPEVPDPDAPKVEIMQDKEMNKLHDIITQKTDEMRSEMQALKEQSDANEKILKERGITVTEDGRMVNEAGEEVEGVEFTEEESFEAALDAAIAAENRSGIPMVPSANMPDPDHEYEKVDDDEFARLMAEDDAKNGKFDPNEVLEKARDTEAYIEQASQNVTAEEAANAARQVAPAEQLTVPEDAAPALEIDSTMGTGNIMEFKAKNANDRMYEEPSKPVFAEPKEAQVEFTAKSADEMIPESAKPAVEKRAEEMKENIERFVPAKAEETIEEALDNESIEQELEKEIDSTTEPEDSPTTNEETIDQLQEVFDSIGGVIGLAPKTMNIDDYKIAAPVSAQSVLASMAKKETVGSDWGLFVSGLPISMSKFTGVELKRMSELAGKNSGLNRITRITEQYTMLYEHDKTPNKPDTVEEWAKNISYLDNDDLYFAMYDATFHNANHITCDCEECGHSWVSPHFPTLDMVTFDTPEDEKYFLDIRNRDRLPGETKKEHSRIRPVSPGIAVMIKDPSIYDTFFAIRVVGDEFYNKYKDTMDLFPYISNFYSIDSSTKTLHPVVDEQRDKRGDKARDLKSRIVIFNRIIKSLQSDEFTVLDNMVKSHAIAEAKRGINYILPAQVCPKCGKPTTELSIDGFFGGERASMMSQVFTRLHLARLASI